MRACQADMVALKKCNDLITCINGCSDTACSDKCVAGSSSTEGKALLECVTTKCKAECEG